MDMLLCLSSSPPTVHSSPLPSAALIYFLKRHFHFLFSSFCMLKIISACCGGRGTRGGIKTLRTKLFPKDHYLLGAFIFFFHPPFPSYWLPLHLLDQCIPRRKQSPPLTTPVTISVRVSLIKLQRGGTTVEPGLMYAGATFIKPQTCQKWARRYKRMLTTWQTSNLGLSGFCLTTQQRSFLLLIGKPYTWIGPISRLGGDRCCSLWLKRETAASL